MLTKNTLNEKIENVVLNLLRFRNFYNGFSMEH